MVNILYEEKDGSASERSQVRVSKWWLGGAQTGNSLLKPVLSTKKSGFYPDHP